MANRFICPYCNLAVLNGAYHEGAEMCQEQMRELLKLLRMVVDNSSPFPSCWHFDPFDSSIDAKEYYKVLCSHLGK